MIDWFLHEILISVMLDQQFLLGLKRVQFVKCGLQRIVLKKRIIVIWDRKWPLFTWLAPKRELY